MSLSLGKHVGLAFVGIVIAAPFLGIGGANGAIQTVTFSGSPLVGMGTLACPSTPSTSKLNVAPGAVVDFINRTGKTATLWAGNSQKSLPDKSLVPVTFVQGPATVTVQMVPDCSLDLGAHGQMTVLVANPGQTASQAPTQASSTDGTTPQTPGADGTPRQGTTARTPTTTPSSSKSATALAPATGESDGTSLPTGSAGVAGNSQPFAQPPTTATNPIVGEVRAPGGPRSASGLLTLIAAVGVVGVSSAVIRAIVSQRAIRALAT